MHVAIIIYADESDVFPEISKERNREIERERGYEVLLIFPQLTPFRNKTRSKESNPTHGRLTEECENPVFCILRVSFS